MSRSTDVVTGVLEATAASPTRAADDATAHALLSCWLREVPGWTLEPAAGASAVAGQTPPGWVGHPPYGRAPTGSATTRDVAGTGPGAGGGGVRIVIPLPRWNARLLVGVRRVSATYRHELALPALVQVGDGEPRPVGLAQLAVLLADALPRADAPPGAGVAPAADPRHGTDAPPTNGASPRGAAPSSASPTSSGFALRTEPLLTRVLDSAAAVAGYLDVRAAEIDRLWSAEPLPFATTEQALLLGHLLHPTPKSRGELGAVERQRYSPETGGRFALRWLSVHRDLVRHGSALGTPAPDLAAALLHDDPTVDHAALAATRDAVGRDRVLLPAHPYEADRLAADPLTADLFETGAVVDLGAWGAPFLPTTSVRTVYRADAPWQLKFSLHVRVTNSMRVTLPKELDRAVESAALARTVVGARTREAAPHFVLVQDPAYLTLARDGVVLDGFSVLLRENRWGAGGPSDVSALTTLCQDHPYGGSSRLAAIVAAISSREHRTENSVAREWFGRFCDVVVRSLVRLYLDVGLCFEAHQQNTLVELEDGWPVRGVYRDSQGYFHREAAHGDLVAVVPGLGEVTESIFPEELADERLVYYLFVNLTLGVINALGPCVDESVLLGDLRRVLTEERTRGGRYPATLLDRLLDDERWPCKANLLTRAHDMDELVGDISTQSVYVTLPNPLLGVGV